MQYRETDFNFVSRLMEQDGIFYFFEHEDGKHTLVLADAPRRPSAVRRASEGALRAQRCGDDRGRRRARVARSARAPLRQLYASADFNFETPATSLLATVTATLASAGNARLRGLRLSRRVRAERPRAKRVAKVRIEEEEAAYARVIAARARAADFVSGSRFNVGEHFRDECNAAATS